VLILLTDRSDAQFEAGCEAAGVDFWLEKRHLQARLFTFLQQRFTLKLVRPRIA
jgi:hypothetical protein